MKKELGDEEKSAIIQAVQNGIREDMRDFWLENKLSSRNSRHGLKWDFINTNLDKKLQIPRLECKIIDRKIWEFPIIFDNITGNLYLVTREKNFWRIKKERNKRKSPHYVDGFVTLNKNVKVEKAQIELFNTDIEFEKEQIDKILELISEYRDKVTKVLICVFQEEGNQLISFRTILTDEYLNVDEKATEDWSRLINVKFDIPYTETNKNDISIKVKKNSELKITLKKNIKNKED